MLVGCVDYHATGSALRVLLKRSPDLGQILTTQLIVTFPSWSNRASFNRTVLNIFCHEADDMARSALFYRLLKIHNRYFKATEILVDFVLICLVCGLDRWHFDKIFDLLMKHGADPNGFGCFLTPLKALVYYDCLPPARLLLEAAADPNFTGNFPRGSQQGELPEWIHTSSWTPLAILQLMKSERMSIAQHTGMEALLLSYEAVI